MLISTVLWINMLFMEVQSQRAVLLNTSTDAQPEVLTARIHAVLTAQPVQHLLTAAPPLIHLPLVLKLAGHGTAPLALCLAPRATPPPTAAPPLIHLPLVLKLAGHGTAPLALCLARH